MRKAAKNSVERCGEHDQAVLRDFRRNVAGAVAFETVWGIAMGFVVFAVLVPAYLNALAAPKLLVGVVSAMFVICTPLQLFAEHLVGGVHRKRNSWLLWTSTGIAYIGCGLLGAVLPAEPTVIRIVVFTAMMAMFAAAVSIAWPVYNTILTDNFPVRRRG